MDDKRHLSGAKFWNKKQHFTKDDSDQMLRWFVLDWVVIKTSALHSKSVVYLVDSAELLFYIKTLW